MNKNLSILITMSLALACALLALRNVGTHASYDRLFSNMATSLGASNLQNYIVAQRGSESVLICMSNRHVDHVYWGGVIQPSIHSETFFDFHDLFTRLVREGVSNMTFVFKGTNDQHFYLLGSRFGRSVIGRKKGNDEFEVYEANVSSDPEL